MSQLNMNISIFTMSITNTTTLSLILQANPTLNGTSMRR